MITHHIAAFHYKSVTLSSSHFQLVLILEMITLFHDFPPKSAASFETETSFSQQHESLSQHRAFCPNVRFQTLFSLKLAHIVIHDTISYKHDAAFFGPVVFQAVCGFSICVLFNLNCCFNHYCQIMIQTYSIYCTFCCP